MSKIKVMGTGTEEFEDEFSSNACERCVGLYKGIVTFRIDCAVGGFDPGGEGVGNELAEHFGEVVFGSGEGEAIGSVGFEVGKMDLMWGFRFNIHVLFADWLGALFNFPIGPFEKFYRE